MDWKTMLAYVTGSVVMAEAGAGLEAHGGDGLVNGPKVLIQPGQRLL